MHKLCRSQAKHIMKRAPSSRYPSVFHRVPPDDRSISIAFFRFHVTYFCISLQASCGSKRTNRKPQSVVRGRVDLSREETRAKTPEASLCKCISVTNRPARRWCFQFITAISNCCVVNPAESSKCGVVLVDRHKHSTQRRVW